MAFPSPYGPAAFMPSTHNGGGIFGPAFFTPQRTSPPMFPEFDHFRSVGTPLETAPPPPPPRKHQQSASTLPSRTSPPMFPGLNPFRFGTPSESVPLQPPPRQHQPFNSTFPSSVGFTPFGYPIRGQQESWRPPVNPAQRRNGFGYQDPLSIYENLFAPNDNRFVHGQQPVNHAVPGSSGHPHPFVFEPARNEAAGKTSLLLAACNSGDLTSLKFSVETIGADVNACGSCQRGGEWMEGVTPLFIAASNGDESIVRYLIGKGANVSVRTLSPVRGCNGMTPLHAATNFADRNSPDAYRKVMEILIENGADPSAPTLNGVPMWALCNHDLDHFRLLISKGMKLDQDDNGRNVLHYWTLCGNRVNAYNAIRAIPDLDALINKANEFDLTPLNFVAMNIRGNQDDPVFEFLLNHPSNSQEKKMDALHLAGSVIILSPFSTDTLSVSKAFLYWKRGMQIRLTCPLIVRGTTECESLAQLEKIQQFPEEHKMHACQLLFGIMRNTKSKQMRQYCSRLIDGYHQQLVRERDVRRLHKLLTSWPMC